MSSAHDLTRRVGLSVGHMIVRAAAVMAMLMVARPAWSAEQPWLTGVELTQKLAQPSSVQWHGRSVRAMLDGLAEFRGTALLLDRRIDPSRTIDLALQAPSLAEVLHEIADRLGGGYAQVGPVAYLGPAPTAQRLRTVIALRRAEVQKLPADVQAAWLKPVAWSWDDLATPRELLDRLAAEAHVTIDAAGHVPHDLWAGADLPPLSLVERLSLVAAQFDLTFALDPTGRQVTLVPMPGEVVVERDYPAGSQPQATLERLKTLAAHSHVEQRGQRIVVRGPIEDHERIDGKASKPAPAKAAADAQQIHTLNLDRVPLSAVLRALRTQLKLDLQTDDAAIAAAGIDLNQLISVHVDKVSTDDLLKAVLAPAKLTVREADGKRIVVPAE